VYTYRRKESLENLFVKKLKYVIVDLDGITKMSDRAICINWFKEQDYSCILGESRNPLNIKGVLEVDNLTPKETKLALKELKGSIPCDVDTSVTHYASYQAPILKSVILYEGGSRKLHRAKEVVSFDLPKEQVPKNIQDICKSKFEEHGFVFNKHDTYYVCSHYSEKKTPGGFTWNPNNPFRMNHWNQDRGVDIFMDVIKTKEYRSFQKKKAKDEIQELMSFSKTNLNERYLGNNPETVSQFLDSYKVLKIQSPMGTGKSNMIDEVINQSTTRGLRVLLITNRITLADDISEKYQNIKHYQGSDIDGKYQIGDNLVCQVNSLWKYSLKYFDVVIIDETTSLLFQLLNLEKHTKNTITKLFATTNKKVVLADAFLFEPLVSLFGSSVLTCVNSYRENSNLIMYKQVDCWALEMLKIAKTETITVSSGSTKILKSLELMFKNSGISYYTVSSETPKNEKELVYKEFKKTNPRWSVIMYSPTITVGLSILACSDNHFHLDRGNSMDVVSSIQMIKRNRQASKIHLFLGERQKYQPTDKLRIQQNLQEFTKEDEDGDILGITEVGEKFSEVQRVYNILENRHQVSFLFLLKYQFRTNGNVTVQDEKVQPFMTKLGKLVQQNQTNHDLNLFEVYKKLSPQELQDVEYKIFNTTKDDEKMKMFRVLSTDETIKLNEEDIDELIKQEIKTPGIIESYKKLQQNLVVINKKNGYSYSIKEYNSFKTRGIDLIELGYTKDGFVYRLNDTIIKIMHNHACKP